MTKPSRHHQSPAPDLVFLAFALATTCSVSCSTPPQRSRHGAALAIAGLGATCLAALLVKQRRERSALSSDNQ